jgi:CheY-like chemotaxis protein
MKVMLVTQQDEVRRIVDEVLAGSGDVVLPATDLGAGLAVSAEHAPELAIIDMALAGGLALAMVHHVAASSPRTSIYVLAAPSAFESAAEALSLGAAGLIVAPPTGDALLRVIADVHARLGNEERATKLAVEAREAAELVDAMTQALVVARVGDLRAMGDGLLALFLIASGARGVAIYGDEEADGTRRRWAGYGTALELLDRYNDLELAQLAPTRHAEVIGLAAAAHMYGCVLLERPDPMRTARVHRVVEFATALLPLCTSARAAIAEDTTAPRPRALPAHVFTRLVQRDVDAAREGHDVVLLCAVTGSGEVDTGPLGPALAQPGAAIGTGDGGEAYVLLPKTPFAAARTLLLDVPLAVGIAAAPAEGKRAEHLLAVAHARARRALNAFPKVRELRTRPLGVVVTALWAASHPTLTRLAVGPDAIDSMVLHACRHARGAPLAEVVIAHAPGGAAVVATARAASGPHAKVRAVEVADAALAGGLVVLVLTARAGWALVAREHQGNLQVLHTSDALVLELLRGRLAEVA